MKRHNWTEEDNQKLMQAVEACTPLFDFYRCQSESYTGVEVWDAIAGRLLPDICVTGKACRRQFDRIKPVEVKPDGWDRVAELVESYERDLGEVTYDKVDHIESHLNDMQSSIEEISALVNKILSVWE